MCVRALDLRAQVVSVLPSSTKWSHVTIQYSPSWVRHTASSKQIPPGDGDGSTEDTAEAQPFTLNQATEAIAHIKAILAEAGIAIGSARVVADSRLRLDVAGKDRRSNK